MSCHSVREALSVRLGGEHEPVPAAEVVAHLGTCADRAGWLVRAPALTRAIRVRQVHRVDAVLSPHDPSWRRVALGAAGVTQLALGVSLLHAALRAERAAGLLPAPGWSVGVLAVLPAADLPGGAATVSRAASRLPPVVALVVRREHQNRPAPHRPRVGGHQFSGGSNRPGTPPGSPGGRPRLSPVVSRAA
ncbi:hypothetical protein [Lentzea cavernae]|uniref:Zinc-finger domain-containing protein n=1 Tax=Lentzea cavernae TaxID=2020703 RepID=A0ABQ3LWS9_9PSEU|nr:hypothetical protein [Lentzea cavernae]GHH27895.1 hypothetical protein GCM10017774_01200 [Lentzea cavernae]